MRTGFALAFVALFFLSALVGFARDASAAQPAPAQPPSTLQYAQNYGMPYCTQSSFPGWCVKTIKIQNDTNVTIYPVLGAFAQEAGKSGQCPHADNWLQAAFGDQTNCYISTFTYHVYINGTQGIPAGKYATIDVPFWSQRTPTPSPSASDTSDPPDPDTWIDWWNGARLYIFDDSTAVAESYTIDSRYPLKPVSGSPTVVCDSNAGACQSAEAYIACTYKDPVGKTGCNPGSDTVDPATPAQLNEFTYASVDPVLGLTNFNVNYNVSNVDQVYLPIAVEPTVWPSQNPSVTPNYLGTILDVVTFRQNLGTFTGAGYPPGNPTKWPIYKVVLDPVSNKPLYPNAGIRVPSAQTIFVTIANPNGLLTFPPNGTCLQDTPAPLTCNPGPTNGPVWTGATLVDGIIAQWLTCVGPNPTSANCPQSQFYIDVDRAGATIGNPNSGTANQFRQSYTKCKSSSESKLPLYLQTVAGNSVYPDPPGYPNLYAYLQFVYGWVPFNVGCPNVDLSTGAIPKEYISLQDNYQIIRGQGPYTGQQLFNPYAQLIHSWKNSTNPNIPSLPYGLESAAYAYSIDDQSSFLSAGGLGLIVDVGGSTALPNKTPYAPPPPFNPSTDIQINLGGTQNQDRPNWVNYSGCGGPNDVPNLSLNSPAVTQNPGGGYTIWVPTANINPPFKAPCYISFTDAKNNVYQLEVLQPVPWPAFTPPSGPDSGGKILFDPTVMTCPNPANQIPGYTTVPSNPTNPSLLGNWCGQISEVSQPTTSPPHYILGTPPSNATNN
jgi:hypothetical protein